MCIDETELKITDINVVNKTAAARHTIYEYNDKYNV